MYELSSLCFGVVRVFVWFVFFFFFFIFIIFVVFSWFGLVWFSFFFFLFASFKREKCYPLKPCSTGTLAGSVGERVYQIISAHH